MMLGCRPACTRSKQLFGMFKSNNSHRAGERSFIAFKTIWVGSPFPEYLQGAKTIWDDEYRDTSAKCKGGNAIAVQASVVDVIAKRMVAGNEKARLKFEQTRSTVSEADAYYMSATFISLGLMSHIVFAHAPALADAQKLDPDQVCMEIIDRIKTSVEKRSSEMHPDYVKAASELLSTFLAIASDQK